MTRTHKGIPFIAIGMLFNFGLAVLGWSGFTAFFSNPARIALSIALVAMCGAGAISPDNMSNGDRADRADRWLLIPFAILGLLAAYVPAYTDRREIFVLDGDTVRWFGVALFVAGGVLRYWPVFVLGRRFSGFVAVQPGHTLETSGIYGVIRHPSYLGFVINALGWALAFRSGVGVLLVGLTLPPLLLRIRSEENLLCEQFGAQYDIYRKRTCRLIPGLY
ncbi:MAG: isoprenylcysteine carboxylmethyltransferase family protein [Bradyrhizobium sp.]|uniref:methyltransferase family protein n=1 Tax=Bradyrhizobium sp. TaxID=376 RepID=UPI001226D913|nr:isoprenylcysteine carboxylmethyltransferase family protein [Bradyrhizobium sp.]THD63726.1 MAG: isoprenylcysteine carboxylmethyltransferase family protein [Bradyrhizobium sp.]